MKRYYRFDNECLVEPGKATAIVCKCKQHELSFLPEEWQGNSQLAVLFNNGYFEQEVSNRFCRVFLAMHEMAGLCLIEKNEHFVSV